VALGTFVAIEATASCDEVAVAAIESAWAAIGSVDRLMHPLRAGSDLARINRSRPGERVFVDSSTWRVLRLAQRVHAVSDGVFDPCLPVMPGRLSDLELSGHAGGEGCWVLCHRPIAIDLGGIAKGYAIDRAVGTLAAAGCVAGLVNAGGDLRLFGLRSETVFVRLASGGCVSVVVENTALAVSDLEARLRPGEHRGYYRRDGGGAPPRRCAAVLAPEAAAADALTKCLLLGSKVVAARALRVLRGVEPPAVLDSADAGPHLESPSDSRRLP
jgi:thiamine biosynthesis lipoprotein